MRDTDQVLEEWTTNHSPAAEICEHWQYISQMMDASGAKKHANLLYVVKCLSVVIMFEEASASILFMSECFWGL